MLKLYILVRKYLTNIIRLNKGYVSCTLLRPMPPATPSYMVFYTLCSCLFLNKYLLPIFYYCFLRLFGESNENSPVRLCMISVIICVVKIFVFLPDSAQNEKGSRTYPQQDELVFSTEDLPCNLIQIWISDKIIIWSFQINRLVCILNRCQ